MPPRSEARRVRGGAGAWFGIRVTVELLVTSKWRMPPHFQTLIVR